ncbi:MORN repeat-containing protein 5 [Homalodisca vitripennis]|nr:MORN repeat-containing protein 5 [Homalodisca vitripennis]
MVSRKNTVVVDSPGTDSIAIGLSWGLCLAVDRREMSEVTRRPPHFILWRSTLPCGDSPESGARKVEISGSVQINSDAPSAWSLEYRNNTGLRPSWDVFWDIEMGGLMGEMTPSLHGTKSTLSAKSGKSGKHVQFVTGSSWLGEWDKVGMCGAGVYKMPHGVTYEGTINAGLFEGIGVLKYPNGGVLEGFWYGGKLKYYQYDYADGLKRDGILVWPYCKAPDRR